MHHTSFQSWRTCRVVFCLFALLALVALPPGKACARDLDEIKQAGVLRHLGIPYAGFVLGPDDGLDVSLMRLFAAHLGVSYELVGTDWDSIFSDLTGSTFRVKGTHVEMTGSTPVTGDIVACGVTVLPWRLQLINYSVPTFPNQVWLVSRADSDLTPITPTGNLERDIELTRDKIKGLEIMTKNGGCLDPSFFELDKIACTVRIFPGGLNDMAPATIFGEAQATLLDVPDALVALDKFPGKLKVIGPMSGIQDMAVGFAKDQPKLLAAFNSFFAQLKAQGSYAALVKKYYPLMPVYFPDFFVAN